MILIFDEAPCTVTEKVAPRDFRPCAMPATMVATRYLADRELYCESHGMLALIAGFEPVRLEARMAAM